MEELYGWMKDSLKHFGLAFADMNKVDVRIDPNKMRIYFIYGDAEVSYKLTVE